MRILFLGTPEFAVPILGALIQNFNVVGVVTNPDEPVGRRQISRPPPVKIAAQKYGIPVLQPGSLENQESRIKDYEPDVFVVAAYGKILPKTLLEIPKYGALNVHPSLLPRWRGPSPVQYTILHGDKETGVTIMLMDDEMDHGPIVTNYKLQMTNDKVTTPELTKILSEKGAEWIVETIPKWIRGGITPIAQDHAKATYSKMLKKEDGKIDWGKTTAEIDRQIRAFIPWPGSFTYWGMNRKTKTIRINKAEPHEKSVDSGSFSPGAVVRSGDIMLVKTKDGLLRVLRLTLEGKKPMDAGSFLNGHSDIIGAILL